MHRHYTYFLILMQDMAILTAYQLSQSLTGQRQNFPREFYIFKNFCIVNTRFKKMEVIYMSGEGLC